MTDREKRLELTDLINKGWEMCTRTRCEECVFSEIKNCRMQYVAAYLLNHGVTVGGAKSATATWIPVTERLPEKVGKYLVFSKAGNYSVQWFHIIEGYRGFLYVENGTVTHWMPLPEPPKEDAHEPE